MTSATRRGEAVAGALNRGFAYRERIAPEADGERLVDYLARRYAHSTHSDWAARIASGLVLLDAAPVTADAIVRRGQELVWQRPPWVEPEAPLAFDVLHEDRHVLAVAKPAGLPTLPGAGFHDATLLGLVRERFPAAAAVHRLGRFTSGVVLFGLDGASRALLARQWASRSVEKVYRALASGSPASDELHLTTPIGPVPHAALGTVHAACSDGKAAESFVRVVERRPDAFLCDVRIATGRPHQIRIHLAAAGHALVGDPLYVAGGIPHEEGCALPGDPGYLLHASSLSFAHPATGAVVRIDCPIPDALRAP